MATVRPDSDPDSASTRAYQPARPGFVDDARARLQPLARQAWLNLKIWVPFLLNPADRLRQVTYHAREQREGFHWSIILPRQCWHCARTDGLLDRELEIERRGFEHAVAIVMGMLASFGFFFLLFAASRSVFMLLLMLASLGVGAGLLWAKSWVETISITEATCREHAETMQFPRTVVDQNELHLFMPNDQLAEATRQQLRAERLGRDRSLPGAPKGVESDVEPPDSASSFRPPPPPPRRTPDLPPIRLDDDDDSSGQDRTIRHDRF